MLVTLISLKSCGVTSTALALAATWPRADSVLVAELDPSGGDIAARFGLPSETGVITLAATLRRVGSVPTEDLSAIVIPHLQDLDGGTRVLTAPSTGAEAGMALDLLAEDLPAVAGTLDVIADCGRLEARPAAAVTRLLAASALTVVVVRPELPFLLRLTARLPEVRALAGPLAVLFCGGLPGSTPRLAAQLDVPVIGHLPDDGVAAAILRGQESRWRRPGRLPLFRAAAAAAQVIAEHTVVEPVTAIPVLAEADA